MAIPAQTQPNLARGFSNQTSISTSLCNFMLDIANIREEIERSWLDISRDIDIVNPQEIEILDRNNAN